MFERFTEAARRALFFARYEASQMGGTSIEPDHLILGLIRKSKGLVPQILALSQISPDAIRAEIKRRPVSKEKISTSVEIPFAAGANRALLYAAEEADRLMHDYIGTEHVLLGLLREEASGAPSILTMHGLRLNDVRNTIVRLLGESETGPESPSHPGVSEQVDQIKRLVQQLAETSPGSQAHELVQRIGWRLDELKRQFGA